MPGYFLEVRGGSFENPNWHKRWGRPDEAGSVRDGKDTLNAVQREESGVLRLLRRFTSRLDVANKLSLALQCLFPRIARPDWIRK